jgi:tRNA uridine 5-carboxymethylaminomethyl modification enzyme
MEEAEPDAIDQVTIEAKYGGYIDRQTQQVERFQRLEHKAIPAQLDYNSIPQMRAEARETLSRVRPRSLGQAGRISGINPTDLATLLVHLKRGHQEEVY